jgi:hypothetical protein
MTTDPSLRKYCIQIKIAKRNRDFLVAGDLIRNMRTIGYTVTDIRNVSLISRSNLYELSKISTEITEEERTMITLGKSTYADLRNKICNRNNQPQTAQPILKKRPPPSDSRKLAKQLYDTIAGIDAWTIKEKSSLDLIAIIPPTRLLEKKMKGFAHEVERRNKRRYKND